MFATARGEGHLGRAAEFRRDDHERLVEPAARFQVGDQGGECLVERRDQIAAQGLEVLAMTVPGVALGALGAKPVDLDQPGTRVEQPATQQDRLSEEVPAVPRAKAGVGRREIDRPPDRLRADDVQGLLLALFQRERRGRLLEVARLLVELIDQPQPALQYGAGALARSGRFSSRKSSRFGSPPVCIGSNLLPSEPPH